MSFLLGLSLLGRPIPKWKLEPKALSIDTSPQVTYLEAS